MKKIFLILSVAIVLSPFIVGAQGLKDAGSKLQATDVGLTANLEGTIGDTVNIFFYIVGTIFLLLIIYGGVVWLKSAGREGEIERAKKILYTSVVGMAVVVASYAITTFVLNRI